MAQAPTIGVIFNAVDTTANAFKAINDRIEAFQKRLAAAFLPMQRLQTQLARFSNVTGLVRVTNATNNLARAGFNAFQKLGQVVPLVGIIGSAASVAGVERMASAWANWGNNIANASRRMGMSAAQLSAFQGAGRIAGTTADAVSGGLQGLGQTLYDTVGGRNPAATVMFNTLGIGFRDAQNHARNTEQVLFEVADKISHMHNPFAQQQVLGALGIPAELLPAMQKGAAGLRAYMEDARRLNPVTDAMIQRSVQLHAAMTRVSLATEGFVNRLADKLEPILTPLLNHFADWIATSPQVAQGIEWVGKQVERLAGWITSGGIERFAHTVEGWLTPLGNVVHWLGGDGGVLGGLEAITGLMAGGFVLKVVTPFLSLATAIGGVTAKLAILAATSPPAWVLAAIGAGAFAVKGAWDDANRVAAATGGDAVDRSTGTDIPMFGGDLFGRQVGPDGRPSQGFFQRLLNPGGSGPAPEGRAIVTPGNLAANHNLPVEARALLDTISGPETKGDYSIINGGRHFTDMSRHPDWLNPATDSTAAGRYQTVIGTWNAAMKAAGRHLSFSPEDQDEGVWALASQTYRTKTHGGDLLSALRDPSKRASIQSALGGTDLWTSLNMAGYARNFAREQGAPLPMPRAQGAPLNLHTPGTGQQGTSGNLSGGNSTVRLHVSSDKGLTVEHLGTESQGGLHVMTPGLLGAQP